MLNDLIHEGEQGENKKQLLLLSFWLELINDKLFWLQAWSGTWILVPVGHISRNHNPDQSSDVLVCMDTDWF